MNRTQLENKKLKQEREENFKNRKQQLTNALIGFGSNIGGQFVKGAMAQDASWYKQYVKDLNSYVNVPTFARVGAPIGSQLISKMGSENRAVPGIMIFPYIDALGAYSNDMNNYANKSYSRFLAEMRKLNSRVGEYEPGEIGLYINVVTSILQGLLQARRALSSLKTYNSYNIYWATEVYNALGFLYNNDAPQRANLIARLNMLIEDFNKNLPIPKDLTLIKRKEFLCNNIFLDSKSAKHQIYAYVNMCLLQYNDEENSADFVRELHPQDQIEMSSYLDQIHNYMLLIRNSIGFNTLMADMRAAFPETEFYKIDELSMDTNPPLSKADEILEQLHNTFTMPFLDYDELTALKLYITDDGVIQQGDPSEVGYCKLYNAPHHPTSNLVFPNYQNAGILMNLYHDNVSGDDILTSTRNIPLYFYGNKHDDSWGLYVEASGSELFLPMVVVTLREDGITIIREVHNVEFLQSGAGQINLAMYNTLMDKISAWSAFDWAPSVIVSYYVNSSGDYDYHLYTDAFAFREYCNYFTISSEQLIKLHDACVSSELFIDSDAFRR